jgi:hypothetical protein
MPEVPTLRERADGRTRREKEALSSVRDFLRSYRQAVTASSKWSRRRRRDELPGRGRGRRPGRPERLARPVAHR